MVAEFEVRLIKAAATTSSEESVSIDWKAFIYEGAEVMWALKPPLEDMRHGERSSRLNIKDLLKLREGVWQLIFHRCGFDWTGALERSLKSVAARSDEPNAANLKTRNEHTVTTSLLLVLLFDAAANRKTARSRSKVVAMICALLTVCWKPDVVTAGSLNEMFCSHSEACAAPGAGACRHQRQAMSAFTSAASPLLGVIACLTFCFGEVLWSCEALASECRLLLLQVARLIDESVPAMQGCDAPLRHQRGVDHRGVKRRAGDDFKASLLVEVVGKRRAHSKHTRAVIDGYSKSTCRAWDRTELRAIMSASWRTLGGASGVFCLQEDGARLMMPGRETMVHILQNNRLGVATYLPPQADMGRWDRRRESWRLGWVVALPDVLPNSR